MKCYINNYFIVGIDYKIKNLCEYVGISRQAWYNIVLSKSIPKVDVAIKICDYFNYISPDDQWDVETFWRF